jgi:nucleosome binding factor SPN SPT16 subunit
VTERLAQQLHDAQRAVTALKRQLGPYIRDSIRDHPISADAFNANRSFSYHQIHSALSSIDQRLANGYAQTYIDLADISRTSWYGTAHELREVLSTMLRVLAPDEQVCKQPWYRQDPNSRGPTQKQRVRYIIRQRGARSRQEQVAEQVQLVDDAIESLVRSTYNRASDAAHASADRREVKRILAYFEAFAHDLLDLE